MFGQWKEKRIQLVAWMGNENHNQKLNSFTSKVIYRTSKNSKDWPGSIRGGEAGGRGQWFSTPAPRKACTRCYDARPYIYIYIYICIYKKKLGCVALNLLNEIFVRFWSRQRLWLRLLIAILHVLPLTWFVIFVVLDYFSMVSYRRDWYGDQYVK